MKIKEKIQLDKAGLCEFGPINIVVFGDSVSHGAINGYMDYENVYWNRLKRKLNAYRDYIPVNVINASVGGTSAKGSLSRMEGQVLIHKPDLVIICFGLNDVNGELENYIGPLKEMFEQCKKENCEAIFMTPNMLNTYVADDTLQSLREYAAKTAEMQNSGRMDKYISAAVSLANDMGIPVCDCYAKWKELSKTQDTTLLLANRINHPTPEMHELFANELYSMIIEVEQKPTQSSSTMYSE